MSDPFSITLVERRAPMTALGAISSRVLEAAGLFGLDLDDPAHAPLLVPSLSIPLAPGSIVLVTGASGSGKSCLLDAMLQALRAEVTGRFMPPVVTVGEREVHAEKPRSVTQRRVRDEVTGRFMPPASPLVIDLFNEPVEETIGLLARVGLAEGALLLRPVKTLSAGQLARLDFALALSRAGNCVAPSPLEGSDGGPRAILVADEFASVLDRVTARALCRNVRRALRVSDAALIAATAHDDLVPWLEPDIVIERDLASRVDVWRRSP